MFKVKDRVNVEVVVTGVYQCPDVMTWKTLTTVHMEDKDNEYVWSTLSTKFPEEGEVVNLSAIIAKTDYHGTSLKNTYKVNYCKFK